ncbi:hypothetical protein [Bacillus suaedaesalsae]|uniref:Uncharacterized protein n=1 Tax=Bacillus suaedaesalsae TaxID=2810349 RepID=A0ABS2DIC3_9BACI|nr:hypothetical protein [Bacillus suaedaesalsae]MBM6618218.1 hypothetical protein [Bacillus suaedaesalsae]
MIEKIGILVSERHFNKLLNGRRSISNHYYDATAQSVNLTLFYIPLSLTEVEH